MWDDGKGQGIRQGCTGQAQGDKTGDYTRGDKTGDYTRGDKERRWWLTPDSGEEWVSVAVPPTAALSAVVPRLLASTPPTLLPKCERSRGLGGARAVPKVMSGVRRDEETMSAEPRRTRLELREL